MLVIYIFLDLVNARKMERINAVLHINENAKNIIFTDTTRLTYHNRVYN